MSPIIKIVHVLVVFTLISCSRPLDAKDLKIWHVNTSYTPVYVCVGYLNITLSTINTDSSMFFRLEPGERRLEEACDYDIDCCDGWQALMLRDSTFNKYTREYLREHDVYDKRWRLSLRDLKNCHYVINIE